MRTGWWSVPGKPLVILVDFTPFIDQKDAIFSYFWEEYNLDSLTGHWDYIEPALFGYAAGKVIEHFTGFFGSPQDRILTHFHQWLSGTGLLYLKANCPEFGHIFTCHGTVLGRAMAENGENLALEMPRIDPEAKSQELLVRAKHSLESVVARKADIFTTVSPATATECRYLLGKEPDLITPNGIDMDVIRGESGSEPGNGVRERLLRVAEAVFGEPVDNDPALIATSGRYEYHNKGLDLLIETLAQLKQDGEMERPAIVFFLVPSEQHGPKNRVLMNLEEEESSRKLPSGISSRYVTHYLVDSDHDILIRKLDELGFDNRKDQKIKIVFVPAYLDGADGIFNMPYYRILSAFDLTLFPSKYEPWGYTPMESLALKIPTLTTDRTGFGQWVADHYKREHPAVRILPVSDQTESASVRQITSFIKEVLSLNPAEKEVLEDNAASVVGTVLWDHQIQYYVQAYEKALDMIEIRPAESGDFLTGSPSEFYTPIEPQINEPTWTRMIVRSSVPESLARLMDLSKNIWWSWNVQAQELFRSIDPRLWKRTKGNPVEVLQQVNYARLNELENDSGFRERMNAVLADFEQYIREKKDDRKEDPIAYFSMEYGLHASLQLYSGGLGVLAGDYLKQASDDKVHMVAIGLLYRYGYFTQRISPGGQQIASYNLQNFNNSAAMPVRDEQGKWRTVSIAFPGRTVIARIWKVAVGRTDLYLLDTDFEDNEEKDRTLTHHLYGGDLEHRLKQEILLGIGGIRTLNTLGINPVIYHLNEGHAAFVGLERLYQLIRDYNLSYSQAREVVRASSLFTTHTPVPAGHDVFPEDLMRIYLGHMTSRLKINWPHFMFLGSGMKDSPKHSFSMSVLASRLSNEINGVSMLHGKVSQKMFADLFPGYLAEENHISFVTNGVHYPTWTDEEWRSRLETEEDRGFPDFNRIDEMSDEEIWTIRRKLKQRLYQLILDRIEAKSSSDYESPTYMLEVKRKLNPDSLTVGFARRFATYKRAGLLFRDPERLDRIVNHPERPVTFIFSGKAHPHDEPGQQLIRELVQLSKQPRFVGKILFLENYDMDLASYLVSGVDVWLNTPTRPLEASGTSGQKVVMNGGLHFSVLDGWWVEGYKPGAGWALSIDRTYMDQELQNELDVDNIYSLFEGEITRAFYERDGEKLPGQWIDFIRKSMKEVAPQFTSHRMIHDYMDRFYNPLKERSLAFREDRFAEARYFASWKKEMQAAWKSLRIVEYESIDVSEGEIVAGRQYTRKLVLDLGSIPVEHVGVELVVSEENGGTREATFHIDYELVGTEGRVATYELAYTPVIPGTFDISTRIYIKNDKWAHRSRLPMVHWV